MRWSNWNHLLVWKSNFVFSGLPLFSGLSNLSLHHSCWGKREMRENRENGETQCGSRFSETVMSYWKGRARSRLVGPPTPGQHGILGEYDPAVSCRGDIGSSSCQQGQGGSMDQMDAPTLKQHRARCPFYREFLKTNYKDKTYYFFYSVKDHNV